MKEVRRNDAQFLFDSLVKKYFRNQLTKSFCLIF